MGSPSTELAERPDVHALVRPVISAAALVEAHRDLSEIVTKALEVGVDYGVIPGTGDKPTLLKPGAERLCIAFGCEPEYRIADSEADHDRRVEWAKRKKQWRNAHPGDRTFTWVEESGASLGLYRYVVECALVRRDDGRRVGTGLGVCSTMESKYVDRPRDAENTVLKMAQKRALVAAVLNAFGLSSRFTQDVEDLPGAETMDRETGEVHPPVATATPRRTAPVNVQAAASAPVPSCPVCGGAMWDNRPKKASGQFKATAPDFKCKDKGCDGKVWPPKDDETRARAHAVAGGPGLDDIPEALDEADDDLPF